MTMATEGNFETDILPISGGDLSVTFLGHASLLVVFNGKNIYVDPFSQVANYSSLPKADLVLVTHEHRDHLDLQALTAIRTPETMVILNQASAQQIDGGIALRDNIQRMMEDAFAGMFINTVPAYNIVHKRQDGQPFHPKGVGNGYIITLGGRRQKIFLTRSKSYNVLIGRTRIYIAGDTENTPEMKALKEIDIAFLPMNLPYTMTPEMVADAAKAFKPGILYPYHYGDTDVSKLVELLKGEKEIEVRIRKMA